MPSATRTDKKKKNPPPEPAPAKHTLGTAILAEQKEINARLRRIEEHLSIISPPKTRSRAPRTNIWGETLPSDEEE